MGTRIGVDIGGSFTDFVAFDEASGRIESLKVFSRPDAPGEEVIEGMRRLAARGIRAEDVTYFTHGTTVGVNAVIQRRGLRLALFTTRHFEDVLEMARLKIADMYNLLSRRPEALIPREHVFGIDERIDADGAMLTPLDEGSVARAVEQARAGGCEGIVIALLHAWRNPEHERRVRAIIERAGTRPAGRVLRVRCGRSSANTSAPSPPSSAPTCSRASRTISTGCRRRCASIGIAPALRVTKSNGGVMTAEQAKTDCIQMVFSGTASGVIGAGYVARLAGLADCLSLDIGGTSADMALIVDGAPQFGTGEFIGEFQVFIPSVSVSSIGDGGGSVAWVDAHGVLKVGPESAGSSPGPACYGRGGERATLTDAFAACGWIGHAALGYDAVRVDREAAHRAVGRLATQLGQDDAAHRGCDHRCRGLRHVCRDQRRGVAPRRRSARLSAARVRRRRTDAGLLHRPRDRHHPHRRAHRTRRAERARRPDRRTQERFRRDRVSRPDARCDGGPRRVGGTAARARRHWLRHEQHHDGPAEIRVSAEMRYRGQSFELDTRAGGRCVRRRPDRRDRRRLPRRATGTSMATPRRRRRCRSWRCA